MSEKEKFEDFLVKRGFKRNIIEESTGEVKELWKWIEQHDQRLLREFVEWRNGEYILKNCRALIST